MPVAETIICAVCERTLLMGERPTRYSPHGDEDFVAVCALCQDVALEHGWIKEGAPTTPSLRAERRRRGLLAAVFPAVPPPRRPARARGADPPPPVGGRAGGRGGGRALQRV